MKARSTFLALCLIVAFASAPASAAPRNTLLYGAAGDAFSLEVQQGARSRPSEAPTVA